VDACPVSWTWYPYLPAGQITILGGPGGSGKGLVASALTASVTTGGTWPASGALARQGTVLWGETEDPVAEVIKPRLTAAAADCARAYYVKPAGFDLDDVKAMIREEDLRLVVLSPMFSFLRGLPGINDELSARAVLGRLQDAIEGTACAVLGIGHTNKKPDLRAIERLLGAVAFANFVRSVLLVSRDKEDAEWFRLVHAKHNLSVRGDDLLYRPRHVGEDPRDQYVKLDWQHPESGNAEPDEMFDRRPSAKGNGESKGMSAGEWLLGYLLDHGESFYHDVVAAGAVAGFKEETLKKAKQRHKRIAHRIEGHQTWWRLS
jgi:AAA domain